MLHAVEIQLRKDEKTLIFHQKRLCFVQIIIRDVRIVLHVKRRILVQIPIYRRQSIYSLNSVKSEIEP